MGSDNTHVGEFLGLYRPGRVVISPYGLAVIETLFDEPFRNRPSRPGDENWHPDQDGPDYAAARIYVNGHGEETIELDQLVPATPEAMARWNLQSNHELLETFQQIRDIIDGDYDEE